MTKPIFFISLAILFIQSNLAHGVEEEIKNFRGIRSSAMGGVITTTGNYSEALFGNPARHSAVDTWKLSVVDLTLEANTELISSTNDLNNLKGSSGASTISSTSKLIGKNEHARFQFLMGYYNPELLEDVGFSFGLLVSAQTNLLMNFTTDLETQTVVDAGPALGLSHPFFDNQLLLGLNLRMLYRVAADDRISALKFLTGSKLSLQDFGRQGVGIDGDLGGYYKVPIEFSFMRLNLGATIHNFAKSHYDIFRATLISKAQPRPVANDRTLSLGTRFDFPDTWIFKAPLLALEMQDIGDLQKRYSVAKRFHFGGETKLGKVFYLRAGLNQGYPSAGIGIDLPVLKLDFTTYGQELAGNSGQLEDRRLMFRLAFEM